MGTRDDVEATTIRGVIVASAVSFEWCFSYAETITRESIAVLFGPSAA